MTIDERRAALLSKLTDSPDRIDAVPEDLYGNIAMAHLVAGTHLEAADASIRQTAEWFEHPHPFGRQHDGECDFAALKLARLCHLPTLHSKLSATTRSKILEFFLTHDFASRHGSENHMLIFKTARYLMGAQMPHAEFEAYARTGAELAAEDQAWLEQFIRYRARCGWGEFDSACYIQPDFECLINLYDFAPDPQLRRLSGMMLNCLLADMLVDSIDNMYGGAHGRIYARQALDHAIENSRQFFCYYFGTLPPAEFSAPVMIDILTSDFQPHPAIVALATRKKGTYENRERVHLHNCADILPQHPRPESIRKYTFVTDDYVMGCVQHQDPYAPGPDTASWYAHHEQHEWDVSFAGHTRARLFSHHPGLSGFEHGYWTGDLRCGCGRFFQNRSALVALYCIPPDQPYQFIHAYAPKEAFDDYRIHDNWVFVRKGNAFAGLHLCNGLNFPLEGEFKACEIRSPGSVNAVVCEAGSREDYPSFDAFVNTISHNPVQFDAVNRSIAYRSERCGVLFLDPQRRQLNGQDLDLDYKRFDCPFLQSEWGSGLVEIRADDVPLTFDFK